MRSDSENEATNNRIVMVILGALAGLSLWLLIDYLDEVITNSRLYTLLFAFTLAFFGSLLALIGPLRFRRAVRAAAIVAVPASVLLFMAGFRFGQREDFLQTGHPVIAFLVLVALPLPFMIARERMAGNWRDYEALFDHAWSIVMRYAAGWLFVAVFWGVVRLSDALLQLVGVEIIEVLLRIDPAPYIMTGAVLGVALAVLDELPDYVTPFLLLRFLRLLLPVFLVVVAVFILALPFRGVSGLFGGLSAAATLMAIAIGSITLISAAVDRNDGDAVQSPMMRGGVQALVAMTPVIAGLALYAVWLRVDQYGWTPDRFAAAIMGVAILAYALSYAFAVFPKAAWMRRIRTANVYLALGVLALAALFLSPVLNVQEMSVRSQLSRFESGRTGAGALDIWTIRHHWGLAGAAAIAGLSTMTDHPEAGRLQQLLAALEAAESPSEFRRAAGNAVGNAVGNDAAQREHSGLHSSMPVYGVPGGAAATLPARVLDDIPPPQLRQMQAGCLRKTPEGAPGCVIVAADLVPTAVGREYLALFMPGDGPVQMFAMVQTPDGGYRIDHSLRDLMREAGAFADASIIDAIRAGVADTRPSGVRILSVGNSEIFIQP